MREITFSEADVQAMASERYHHPDPRVQRHREILCLKYHAARYHLNHDDVATLAGCARRTVQRTLAASSEGGLERIRQVAVQESPSALDDQRACLEELFTQEPPRSVKHAQHTIQKHTGLCRGLTQVRHFLHRLGRKPRKVAAIPLPPKATLEEHAQTQQAFLANQLEPRLQEARAGRRQVFFV